MHIFWWFDKTAWVCPEMISRHLACWFQWRFSCLPPAHLGKMINQFGLVVCWVYPPPPTNPLKLKVLPDSLQKMYIIILVVTIATWMGQWTQLICFQRWASFTHHHSVLIKGMPSWTWPRSNSPGCGLVSAWQTPTLLGTNTSLSKAVLKMRFLFPRWDILIPWRVFFARKNQMVLLLGCLDVNVLLHCTLMVLKNLVEPADSSSHKLTSKFCYIL